MKKSLEAVINNNNSNQIIFIDKNHPPKEIPATINFLKEQVCKVARIEMKIMAVIPYCNNIFLPYPFSSNFLFTCIYRALKKETSDGLIGEPIKVKLIFYYFSLINFFSLKGDINCPYIFSVL